MNKEQLIELVAVLRQAQAADLDVAEHDGIHWKQLTDECEQHWINQVGDVVSTVGNGRVRKWNLNRFSGAPRLGIGGVTRYQSRLMLAYWGIERTGSQWRAVQDAKQLEAA